MEDNQLTIQKVPYMLYNMAPFNEASSIDAYFNSLPCGYRFAPTDEELISCYLKRKLLNQPLPTNSFLDINIYQYHPQQLTERYSSLRESEWYVFTPRNRKYPNGSRPDRVAHNGYWKLTGIDAIIKSVNDQKIGVKKTLDFYDGKHPQGIRSEWKMHEYILNPDIDPPITNNNKGKGDMKLDDCVLCKIYKTKNGKNNNNNNAGPIYSDQSPVQPDDHHQDQSPILIGESSSSSTILKNGCGSTMPRTSTILTNKFGDLPLYYDPSLQNEVLRYRSEFANNFNNQTFTKYNIHSAAHTSNVSPMESFSYPFPLHNSKGTSTGGLEHVNDQVLMFDPNSVQLPVHAMEYNDHLLKEKEEDHDYSDNKLQTGDDDIFDEINQYIFYPKCYIR